jgi:DNA-binding transcriptional LysR family regulator
MQLEALQIFCDVARHRSFSRAAAAHGKSQSAASQIVHQLEEHLGVQLINRSTRPLQLTALGKAYYEGCRDVVDRYLELEASIRQAHTEVAVTVQVAAIYSVGLGDISHYLERFRTQHPHARVHMEYLHPDRVYEQVRTGAADLGLVSFPRKTRELTTLPWREEEMVLTCSPQHRLAPLARVKPAQLTAEKFIHFAKELVIRRKVDQFLREQGVKVEVALEFDNIENIKKAIAISAGVALLPEPTLRQEIQAGTLVAVPLEGCRMVRPLGILHRRHPRLSATAQQFMDLLRQPLQGEAPPRAELNLFAGSGPPRSHANGNPRGREGAASPSRKTGVK